MRRPSELVDQRREGDGRVGDAAGDDHVGAKLERLHQPGGADIRICRQHAIANGGERLTGIHVDQRLACRNDRVEIREEIVAEHHRYFHAVAQTEIVCERADGRAAGQRIHASRVGDDANAAVDAGRQHISQMNEHVSRIPAVGISRALLLQNCHGDLGEVVHHQIIDGAALDLTPRGGGVVSPEPAAIGHDDALFRHFSTSLAITMRCTSDVPSPISHNFASR